MGTMTTTTTGVWVDGDEEKINAAIVKYANANLRHNL